MRIAVTVAAVIWILITARDVLQPLAVGLLFWLVLSASTRKITSLLPARFRRGKTMVRIIGASSVVIILLTLGVFVAENIAQLHANRAIYEQNLDHWLEMGGDMIGLTEHMSVSELLGRIELTSFALSIAGSTAAYLGALMGVLVYVVFIFVEVEAMDKKIAAFAGEPVRERHIRRFMSTVKHGVDDFLGVQVFVGMLQAVPTYVLLALLGVDAPLFWSVLVLLFSFIPTIGTLFGIALPTAMTLLQFGTLEPVLIVGVVLGIVQITCSNVILTQMMSKSLNLSPLVVLFAVFAGGAVWGITGALIAVPVLTIIAIVCAEREEWRPVAIALSSDGSLPPRLTDAELDALADQSAGGDTGDALPIR
ncbi:AI-2E family transporter [Acuticoccus sp. M5D2P5]|uniref:AI-2E family transporter n=1 Tax=Acuticoccus kalidii TaxID=2910977 RepID=UPI001F19027F|nr:AI-2E family transporter [Acuticoccus kalidii]MCF3933696.1 AI-2E family transporter [Acuticoccus kalidii]